MVHPSSCGEGLAFCIPNTGNRLKHRKPAYLRRGYCNPNVHLSSHEGGSSLPYVCKSLPARIGCARQCGEVGKVLGIEPSQGADKSRKGLTCAVHHPSLDTKARWTPKPNIVHTNICNIFRLIRLIEVYQPESDTHACMDWSAAIP